jgi:REP element-mobilizing transposase RayT
MDRCWLLTWTTYGTRLPGDARGFVSDLRDEHRNKYRMNQVGTAPIADIPGLRRFSEQSLKCPPIFLTRSHAELLLPQFRETTTHRGWTLYAVAILTNHIHIVVGVIGDPDPSDLLGDFKSYGSRPLNRRWKKPASGTWWTAGGSKRKAIDDSSVWGAIVYVRDQENPLLVWLNDGAILAHFGEAGCELLCVSPPSTTSHRRANTRRSPGTGYG